MDNHGGVPCAGGSPGGEEQRVGQEEAGAPASAHHTRLKGAAAERYDTRILRAFRRIIRAVDMYSHKLSANHRITGPQLLCLLTIAEEGPLTASQISRRVYLSASTIVGILDRLEEKGLVRRERNRRDRRLVNVSVTERGRVLAAESPSPLQDTLAEALRGMTELERATIALSLERIVDLMETRSLPESELIVSERPKAQLAAGEEEPA